MSRRGVWVGRHWVSKTTIALPVDVVERIEALVGKGHMAAFLREAVREKLELDKRQSSADE